MHYNLLRNNSHNNERMQEAFNRSADGKITFTVIEICSEEDKARRENFYIQEYQEHPGIFNAITRFKSIRRVSLREEGESVKIQRKTVSKIREIIKTTGHSLSGFITVALEKEIRANYKDFIE